MSCTLNNRIPEILNVGGIRKNAKLINKLRQFPQLNQKQINIATEDVFNLIDTKPHDSILVSGE